MAYESDEVRIVKTAWGVLIRNGHKIIPAGEEIRVAHDAKSGHIRVFWSGFKAVR